MTNFGSDLKDSECYLILFNLLAPDVCDVSSAMKDDDLLSRAELVIKFAAQLGCRKFLGTKDIVEVYCSYLLFV